MYFDIIHPPRECPKELLSAAVMFAYKYHSIPAELATEIEFTGRISSSCVGFCEVDMEESMSFLYVHRKLDVPEIIKTIFHEFTHVQQIASNRLVVTEELTDMVWDGITYSWPEDNDEYNDQPWEVDAYHHEELMYELFSTNMRQTKFSIFFQEELQEELTEELE